MSLQGHRLRVQMPSRSESLDMPKRYLDVNAIYCGDSRALLRKIEPDSVALSFWSPPYFVGKSYERDLAYEDWQEMVQEVVQLHYPILKPGGFLAVNVADILAFPDPDMPRIQANVVSGRRSNVTRDQILEVQRLRPDLNRHQVAQLLGCSEQTVQRRLSNNNVRGGKSATQSKVKLVGGMLEEWASDAGMYLYDRRVWVKDPCWENSRWHSLSYRSVDEFEYVYVFWKPGITDVDRSRLSKDDWSEWGSRGVWNIPSVRSNDIHEAQFPLELARRAIRLWSGTDELVLDCFVGSGTTVVAAIEENRRYIGIELLPRYADLASKRCAEVQSVVMR